MADPRSEYLPTEEKRVELLKKKYGLTDERAREVLAKSKGAGGAIMGGLQTAANIASGGISDAALSGLRALGTSDTLDQSRGYVDALRAESEAEHPMAKWIGRGAGVAGMAALPFGKIAGAVRAAPRVGAAIGRLPGVLQSALGMGVEGAAMGGTMGAAESVGRPDLSLPGAAAKGAALGGATAAALPIAGFLGKGVGYGVGGVVGNRDPRLVAQVSDVIRRNRGMPSVTTGRPYEQASEEMAGALGDVRGALVHGGARTRELIERSGAAYHLAGVRRMVEEPFERMAAEGTASVSTQNHLRQRLNDYVMRLERDFGEVVDPATGAVIMPERPVPAAHLKTMLDELRSEADLAAKTVTGAKSPALRAAGETSHAARETLGATVPGYEAHMADMAPRARILSRMGKKPVEEVGGDFLYSPDSVQAIIKRLATGKASSTEMEAVETLMREAGRDPAIATRARDAFLYDLFEKGGPTGSKGVNLYKAVGEAVGGIGGSEKLGKMAGGIAGGIGDFMGPKVVQTGLRAAHALGRTYGRLPEKMRNMIDAATARGPAALATTYGILERDPEFQKATAEPAADPWEKFRETTPAPTASTDPWAKYR